MEDILTVGAAVYIPHLPLTLKWKLDPQHSVISSELIAILKALLWILQHGSHKSNFLICSDSYSSLQLISQQRPSSYRDLISRIHLCLLSSRNYDQVVKLQWTPAHCGIAGNEAADDAAKSTANLPITHYDLDKAEKTSIHKKLLQEDVCRSWASMAPRQRIGQFKPEFKKWPWAERSCRSEETLISNFRLGNPPLNLYLHRARIVDNPHCPWCPRQAESSEHFLLHCRMYQTQRAQLFQQLRCLGIPNPTLAILLGGGGFSPHKNKRIIDSTCAFCRTSQRFTFF